jgi:hypothetical protein
MGVELVDGNSVAVVEEALYLSVGEDAFRRSIAKYIGFCSWNVIVFFRHIWVERCVKCNDM